MYEKLRPCVEMHAQSKRLAVLLSLVVCRHPVVTDSTVPHRTHVYPTKMETHSLHVWYRLRSCLPQAAPPPLSRCRISAGVEQEKRVKHPSSLAEQRPALRVRWEKQEGVHEMWPGKRESS